MKDKILICLLEKPRSAKEIVQIVKPEFAEKNINRYELGVIISNWYRKGSKTGYFSQLINECIIERVEGKKYDINWDKFFDHLKNEFEKTGFQLSIDTQFGNFIKQNREFLFNHNNFKELYELKCPSLLGILNISLFYFLWSLPENTNTRSKKIGYKQIKGKLAAIYKPMKSEDEKLNSLISNIKTVLLRKYDKSLLEKVLTQMKQEHKTYNSASVATIREYFRLLTKQSYSDDHSLLIFSLFDQGVELKLEQSSVITRGRSTIVSVSLSQMFKYNKAINKLESLFN